ncbi:MAG: S-methyl-5-thioribose-1-phosphate isomerase [Candidatus Kapabacteria bacterium]|nr:S-methyl-5-thioribose-1-phosphate isomerase [Candidatus Kapabacteria bacterium]
MLINSIPQRTIRESGTEPVRVVVLDQRNLPHKIEYVELQTFEDICNAINDMIVRGAPLIGVCAAYGLYLAAFSLKDLGLDSFQTKLKEFTDKLIATRPTAINLRNAISKAIEFIGHFNSTEEEVHASLKYARNLYENEIDCSRKIGEYGVKLIEDIYQNKKSTVNILTHCNAGWLATIDYGTATAPIYLAMERGIPLHVWVDETRPRNQGAKLTAWELMENGVPCTLIPDNAGGHLMQHGLVDLCLVGSDRTTRTGDVANKIGTYLKALAAKDNSVPFYVALPCSSFDWSLLDGINEIQIEQRNPEEVLYVDGLADGKIQTVLVPPLGCNAANYGFDVTPARLVTGLITEHGIFKPEEKELNKLREIINIKG